MRGFLLLVLSLLPVMADAAQVNVYTSNGHKMVMLSDVIVAGDAARLEAALAQAGASPLVYLASRGGDVDEGMAMGRLLRKYNATVTHGYCASSCVFAFLGGTNRLARSHGGAALYIHRPELAEAYVAAPSPFAKQMLDMLRDYTVEMIGSDSFYNIMMRVPFSTPRAFSYEALYQMRVVTGRSGS